jgi:protein-S-isoprenylcysteine O-methyltransferase Ste14
MYLALLLALTGWGLYLANIFSLIFVVGFVLYMNRFQIQPEERALEEIFGAKFSDYKNQVRRWI